MIGVCIVTYNQEKYIAQCIDSALSQVCTEPVRIYVADDCSTDRTAEVCKSYADKIVFIEREKNLGLVGNTMQLLDKMRSDGCFLIAMLDGDDYWIDNRKLQKQYDYMQVHPEYGLVHTCIDLLYPTYIVPDKRSSYREGDVFDTIESYSIGNCSVVFKANLLQLIDFNTFTRAGMKSVDYPMYYIFASKTQFGFIPDHTAVWRRGHESVSNSNDLERQIAYIQNGLAQWKYLSTLFPDKCPYSEESGQFYFHERSFHTAFRLGHSKRAIKEYHLMSESRKKNSHNLLKYIVVHFPLTFFLWRLAKQPKAK